MEVIHHFGSDIDQHDMEPVHPFSPERYENKKMGTQKKFLIPKFKNNENVPCSMVYCTYD